MCVLVVAVERLYLAPPAFFVRAQTDGLTALIRLLASSSRSLQGSDDGERLRDRGPKGDDFELDGWCGTELKRRTFNPEGKAG